MGYIQTPDGRTILAPDIFGGGPAPFDSSLQGAPPTIPTPDVAPSLPSPSALNQQAPADTGAPAPQLQPIAIPPPGPPDATINAAPQLKPDYPVALPTPPTPAQAKANAQAAAKQAQYDASPAGLQAKADAANAAADAKKQEAIDQNLAAETEKNDKILAAQKQTAEDDKANAAKKVAYQAQYDQTHAQKEQQLAALNFDADNFKINPNDDGLTSGQHFGMLIAAALSGIGNALMGKGDAPNPVIQMLKEKADQSIRLQMDQRDQLRKRAEGAEHQLDRYDSFSKDQLAQFDAASSTLYKKLANDVAIIGTQSANPEAKARATQLQGDLLATSAQRAQTAADRATQAAQHQQMVGLQAQAQADARKRDARDYAEKVREFDTNQQNTMAEKIIAAQARGDAAGAKQLEKAKELGVWDPTNSNPLLSKDGKATMAAADDIEVAARKDPGTALATAVTQLRAKNLLPQVQQELATMQNPTAQDAISVATKALRDHAGTVEVALAPDKETAAKVRNVLIPSQALVDKIEDAKRFLENDPKLTDRAGWAGLGTTLGGAMSDWTQTKDMKFTSREAQAIDEHLFHFDPSSLLSREFDKGKALASLQKLEDGVKDSVDLTLKGNGISDGWTPKIPAAADKFGGQTSVESAQDAEAGVLKRGLDRLSHPFTGTDANTQTVFGETTSQRQRDAENAAPLSATGMDPADESRLIGIARRYDNATNSDRRMIVSNIVAPIAGGRPEITNAMLPVIKAENPDLYRDVLKSLPPLQRKEIESRDAALAKIAPNLPPLPAPTQ